MNLRITYRIWYRDALWPICFDMKKALITGITGQDGSYLVKLLPNDSAFSLTNPTFSSCPRSAVKVTTEHWYFNWSHLRITLVSRPPE